MQKKVIIIILILLIDLSGCASRLRVKKAPTGTPVLLSEQDVLIFGRIRWIQNGEEATIDIPETLEGSPVYTLSVIPKPSE